METHRIFHLLLPQDQRAALVQWLSHRFGTDNVRVEHNWTYVDVREEPLKALRELLQVSDGCSTRDVLIKDLKGFNMVLRLEGRITRYYDFCVGKGKVEDGGNGLRKCIRLLNGAKLRAMMSCALAGPHKNPGFQEPFCTTGFRQAV